MIVTPDAPVKAVNNAHATSEMIARPPGNQPRSACERRTKRAGACPALNRNPAYVNSGIATSTGVSDKPKNSMATTDRSTPSRSNTDQRAGADDGEQRRTEQRHNDQDERDHGAHARGSTAGVVPRSRLTLCMRNCHAMSANATGMIA